MARLTQLAPESATGKVETLFQGVQAKLGLVPNMMRAMGNSPAVLEGYLGFAGSVAKGSLAPKLREQIALTVAETNGCDYCLAAHSTVGKMTGLTSEQILDARRGFAVDSTTNAILQFARKIVDRRGRVDESDFDTLREHGVTDAAIADIVAQVALDIFTNYFNIAVDTDVDFPRVPALETTAATV